MEIIIQIKNFLASAGHSSAEKITGTYWPIYYSWLAKKLADHDPFSVLTIATSFAVFFFLIFYWAKNQN